MIIVNPGTFGCDDATAEHSYENMKHFLVDCAVSGAEFVAVPTMDYGEGRFCFLVWKDNNCAEIQMPGWSLEKVRYVKSEGQNIWDFPRLYVDGGSWIWYIAADIVKRILSEVEE